MILEGTPKDIESATAKVVTQRAEDSAAFLENLHRRLGVTNNY